METAEARTKKLSNVRALDKVYLEYGPKSNEFIKQIEKFIFKLLKRHYPNYLLQHDAEDIVQGCFIRAVTATAEYFDPKKGKLVTFLYTTVRNFISYDKEKKQILEDITYDYEYNLENTPENEPNFIFENLDFALDTLANMDVLQYSKDFQDALYFNKIYTVPLYKYLHWKLCLQ